MASSTPIDHIEAEIMALFHQPSDMKMVLTSDEQMRMLERLPPEEQKAFIIQIIKEGTVNE
jgi:hypothetical protein